MSNNDVQSQTTEAAPVRLTAPLLEAMQSALQAALAGENFDGGDFDGLNPKHFERASDWVAQEMMRRRGKAA